MRSVDQMLTMYERGAIDRRQFLAALATVAAATGVSAQSPRAPASFRGQVLNHVTLSVSDVGRSRAFYQRLLGATDILPPGTTAIPQEFADLRVGSGFLGLYRIGQPGRIDHFSVGIDAFNDERVIAELRREFPDTKPNFVPETGPTEKEVYLTDPDGIRVQLSAPDMKLR